MHGANQLSLMRSPRTTILSCRVAVILLICTDASAQKEFNNWYFGTYAGLNFNTNPPSFQQGALNTYEGSAAVSNANGELLFYTDGRTVYNRDHQEMPNGFGLLSNPSSTQAALIVRDPGSPYRFYLFTSDAAPSQNAAMYYSIVDMREDGGKGDIVYKNYRLLVHSTEQLAAIGTCDGDAFWIITRKRFTNQFYAWYLNRSGIDPTPVISDVDSKDGKWPETGAGWLTPNPTGEMLAMAHFSSSEGPLAQLFKFDKITGKVSDPIHIPTAGPTYGCAFSPNGMKVYFGGDNSIIKFDVSTYERSAIMASQHTVPTSYIRGTALRLGPDGNIYARARDLLGRITNPNSDGFGFTRDWMILPAGNEHTGGLPVDPIISFAECPLPIAAFTNLPDTICIGNTIQFTDSSKFDPRSWNWSFEGGLPATSDKQSPPPIRYNTVGRYRARLIVTNRFGKDTIDRYVNVQTCPVPVVALRDTTICVTDCIAFADTSSLSKTWDWRFDSGIPQSQSTRQTQPICYNDPGTYLVTLIAGNEYGYDTATCTVTVMPCDRPRASALHDTLVCAGNAIDFTDQSAGEITSWQWQFEGGEPATSSDQHPMQISYATVGIYQVRLIATNENGSDTSLSLVRVRACLPPEATLANYTICEGDSIDLRDASTNEPQSWEWTLSGQSPEVRHEQHPGMLAYDVAGEFPIRLVVSNEFGADTAFSTVTVTSSRGRLSTYEISITDSLTRCTTADTSIWVYAGCRDLEYSIASASQVLIIAPASGRVVAGDSLLINFTITPRSIGNAKAIADLNLGSDTASLTLNYRIAESGKLSAQYSSIDLGETNICEDRDTTIRLTNSGCDTVIVSDISVDRHFVIDTSFPIALAPGENVDIPVVSIVDTSGKPSVLVGQLSVESSSSTELEPILLTRSLVYPTRLRLEAVDAVDGQQLVRFSIILDGEVPAAMTALHFDFLHNNDLLSFESLRGDGLAVVSAVGEADQRQRFTLSPVRKGILGEITFKPFLAEAQRTDLSFANISFEAAGISFASECIAVVSDSGGTYYYEYTCGDEIVRRQMRGQPLLRSLYPNPARETVRLEFADFAQDATVEIIDLLGAVLLNIKTSAKELIDLTGLESGRYHLRVAWAGRVQTQSLIIEK
jgi:PKD repeat protein